VQGQGDGITVRLLQYTREGPRLVAAAAKITLSRKPVDDILAMPDSEVEEWIVETWRRQHFSPWEHSVYTWMVEGCSRVCTHQLVRHRIASYTQQSMRYTEGVLREVALEAARRAGMECPAKPGRDAPKSDAYRCYAQALHQASLEGGDEIVGLAWRAYVIPPSVDPVEAARGYLEATARYYRLLAQGVPREDARFLIPHGVRTRITVTMNARELATSFLPLRACTRAQWEIRRVAWRLWRLLNEVHPELFRWTGPRCVYTENTVRDKPAPLSHLLDGGFTIPRCPELVPRQGIPQCLLYSLRDALGGGED